MADPASNLLSDALMGKSANDTSPLVDSSAPPMSIESLAPTQPLSTTSPEPVAPSMTTMEVPAPPAMPSLESLQPTPVPGAVVGDVAKPLETAEPVPSVSPAGAPPTVESLPDAPKKNGLPPAAVFGGLAVLAVLTVGVVAAVVLSGQSQEIRQRAYVAPPAPTTGGTALPSEVLVIPTGYNAFVSLRSKYPNALSHPIATDGVRGTLFTDSEAGLVEGVYFAEISGLESSEDKIPYAWLSFANGSYLFLSEIQMDASGEKSYFGSEQFSDLGEPSGLLITYESPNADLLNPSSQKVTYVGF